MLNLGLFLLFAPLAAIELLFYRQFSVLLVGGLYFALAAQADYASSRLLARGLYPGADRRRRHWSEDDPAPAAETTEEEELEVQKLSRKRARARAAPEFVPPPMPVPAPAATSRARPPRAFPHPATGREYVKAQPEPARPKDLPPAPNFRGRAHEVLGVHENAKTRTIVNAFRHWVKRFHPDRAADLPAELANAKVRQLTEAKERLLENRRKRGRKAA